MVEEISSSCISGLDRIWRQWEVLLLAVCRLLVLVLVKGAVFVGSLVVVVLVMILLVVVVFLLYGALLEYSGRLRFVVLLGQFASSSILQGVLAIRCRRVVVPSVSRQKSGQVQISLLRSQSSLLEKTEVLQV